MNQTRAHRVVFVGGGHAHLYSLKNADKLIREDALITVVGPDQHHYYSGMGPGMLSRIYTPEDARVDIPSLIHSRGGGFIRGHITAVDPDKKTLSVDTGETLAYDIASFNVGSHVPLNLIDGAEQEAYPVKPIENLEVLREKIISKSKISTPVILIIGAGPAGVELAGNIQRLVHSHAGKAEIILAGSEHRILPRFPEKAGILAQNSLIERGITIMPGCMISSMHKGIARTETGKEISYDLAVLTIGIQPKRIFGGFGIEIAQNGSLMVNTCLQSTTHPDIFGGGDCITFKKSPLDMVGVYAVKQAPILFHNIRALLKGEPLKEFVPQKRYLLIFNLGDGTGIFIRGSIIFRAKLAFKLKDFIDRRFISQFQI